MRKFLMKAHDFDWDKHTYNGMLMSKKVDGMRAVWMPRFRGLPTTEVPFANVARSGGDRLCTGLFSMYANVISAPDWWLDGLPVERCLDGELFVRDWNSTMSCCRMLIPDSRLWGGCHYHVFDSPAYWQILADGVVNDGKNYKMVFDWNYLQSRFGLPLATGERFFDGFDFKYRELTAFHAADLSNVWSVLPQTMTPSELGAAREMILERMAEEMSAGGEGLILRHPASIWEPIRSHYSFKLKRLADMEGRVVGYTWGLGKHVGRIGSVRLRLASGIEFDLSGFTDAERAVDESVSAPPVDGHFVTDPLSSRFPLGSAITFSYRELSPDGRPKEARYLRPRPTE